jgi:hypothetical protein
MLKKKPFLAFSARKSKSAVFDFLHFQSLTAIENAWPSLASPGSALNQRFLRSFEFSMTSFE